MSLALAALGDRFFTTITTWEGQRIIISANNSSQRVMPYIMFGYKTVEWWKSRKHLKYLKEKEIVWICPISEPNYILHTSCKNPVFFIGHLKQNKQTRRDDKDNWEDLEKIQIEHKMTNKTIISKQKIQSVLVEELTFLILSRENDLQNCHHRKMQSISLQPKFARKKYYKNRVSPLMNTNIDLIPHFCDYLWSQSALNKLYFILISSLI